MKVKIKIIILMRQFINFVNQKVKNLIIAFKRLRYYRTMKIIKFYYKKELYKETMNITIKYLNLSNISH